MKTRSKLGQAAARLSVALLLLTAGTALAQTKTWVGNGAQAFNQGIWGGNANWSPSGPANGADNTAYFTTLSKETQAGSEPAMHDSNITRAGTIPGRWTPIRTSWSVSRNLR